MTPLWHTEFSAPVSNVSGTPASDGKRLYTLLDGVVAFDAVTGDRLWSNPLPYLRSRPRNLSVRNGRVFGAGGVAFALDAVSGRELWRYSLPIPDTASAGLGRAAADESSFYVGTDTHEVYALDQATGALLWRTDIGPGWKYRGIVTGITTAGDTIFVSAREFSAANGYVSAGWIIGLDRATGQTLWSFRNGSGTDWRTVSAGVHVTGRLLLASDHLNGSVFAVDRGTAREVWRRVGPRDKFGALTRPVVVNGRAIYASIDNYMYALDPATGAVRWQTQNEGSNLSVAVCGTRVFANYMDLAILDSDSGSVRLKVRTGEIFSDFAVAAGRVFAVSDRGIYAFSCR